MKQTKKYEVHPVDVHVGERLKDLRLQKSMTQTEIAHALGLSFQQVQKYERGTNRISASKLWDAAGYLGVGVQEFYRGLDNTGRQHHDGFCEGNGQQSPDIV